MGLRMGADEYIVLFSCKDEGGVVQDHPLRSFELELFAQEYLNGYIDAIINHTNETDHEMIRGQFRISKIGEENEHKKIPKEAKKKNSPDETA